MVACSSDTSLSERLATSSVRWVNLVVLALLGAVVFELVLPLAWQRAKDLQFPYSPVFLAFAAWLSVVLVTYLVSQPIQVRKHQWRRMLWYPPTWFALPLACALAAASERLAPPLRPQANTPNWQDPYIVAPIALAVILGLAVRQLPWRNSATVSAAPSRTPNTSLAWSEIEAWLSRGECPIGPSERDLFHHHRIAARIARYIVTDRGHIALIGRFGSGKSSILNLTIADLAQRRNAPIVAELDVWAVSNPEDVPRVALNRIVDALDEYVNVVQFRSLPLAYQRLVSKEPTGWLAAALDTENVRDSIELLGGLSSVLATIDTHLLLVVQDVERAGPDFDTRHLQRLLWALRNRSRIQFILCADPDHVAVDFPKLCDSIELVPAMEVGDVAEILTVAYGHWRTKFPDIDPHPNRGDADKLEFGQALMGGMVDRLRHIRSLTQIMLPSLMLPAILVV